jgi:CheY-like chemotaxis protein
MSKDNLSVLIVDDDAFLAEAYRRVLERDGYSVQTASDVAGGFRMAKQMSPEVVFIDRVLGDADGLELLHSIKEDETLKHCFCVLISGQVTSADNVAGGLNAGADGYLRKPLTNKELLAHTGAFFKQLEIIHKLTTTEHKLQKLITHNPDAVIFLNKSGVIRFANPAAEKLFGKNNESLKGMVFGIPAVTDNSAEVVVRSETGYDVIARMNLTEEVWEGEEGYIATLRDITQLQKAEKRKEQLNNLLEAVRKINQLIIHEAEGDNLFKKAAEALLELRDQTLPQYHAQLDELAQKTSMRFAEQGLTLFTDEDGNVPAHVAPPATVGYNGFSEKMQVNADVMQDHSLIRTGTNGETVLDGSNAIIDRVLEFAF